MTDVHRGATIFAGFLTLFESIVWVVFSIIFVAAYTCHYDVPYDETKAQTAYSIFYVTYFKGPCRGSGNPSPNAFRTYIWMLIYAVLSACWIPVSVLLIVAAIIKVRGKGGACLYYPWLIVTSLIHIFDLIGTIIYSIDISRTLTTADYENFMQPLIVHDSTNKNSLDGITVLPAIELTLFCSRVVVLWIINFIVIGVVIQAVRGVLGLPPLQGSNYSRNITKEAGSGLSNPDFQNNRSEGKPRWVNAVSGEPLHMGDQRGRNDDGRRRNSWEPDRKHPWVMIEPSRVNDLGRSGNLPNDNNAGSRENTPPAQSRVFNVDGSPMGETPGHHRKFIRNPENRDAGVRPWSYTHGDMGVKPKHDTREPEPDYTMHPNTPRRYPSVITSRNDYQQEFMQRPREQRSGAGAY